MDEGGEESSAPSESVLWSSALCARPSAAAAASRSMGRTSLRRHGIGSNDRTTRSAQRGVERARRECAPIGPNSHSEGKARTAIAALRGTGLRSSPLSRHCERCRHFLPQRHAAALAAATPVTAAHRCRHFLPLRHAAALAAAARRRGLRSGCHTSPPARRLCIRCRRALRGVAPTRCGCRRRGLRSCDRGAPTRVSGREVRRSGHRRAAVGQGRAVPCSFGFRRPFAARAVRRSRTLRPLRLECTCAGVARRWLWPRRRSGGGSSTSVRRCCRASGWR
jgi:hypothetical protein